jgi:hypothetical protein
MSTPVVTWPMPDTELPSFVYEMSAAGTSIPVWLARVREHISMPEGTGWTHMFNGPTDWASFARLDAIYPIEISVRVLRPFQSAQVIPNSYSIEAEIENDVVRFTLDKPRHVTLVLDGRDEHPLHLSAREIEDDAPTQSSDDVIYFGPGEHWVDSLALKSGQTLYLHGAAILRATLPHDARGKRRGVLNLTSYRNQVLELVDVENVRICGRGIIDGGALPHPAKTLLLALGAKNIRIEGVTFRNSPSWHMMLMNCEDVVVENIACISGRLNSDGVNCVSTSRMSVRNCFVRNHDDSFVVKTMNPEKPSTGVLYENCVAWCDWGFAFGVSYETRAPISDVTFRDCEVLHARNWPIGVRVCDAATVESITFERINAGNLETTQSPGMGRHSIKLEIAKDEWGKDENAGQIRDITFRDVQFENAAAPPIRLHGFDAQHRIENTRFENLKIGERKIYSADDAIFETNEFAAAPDVT